MPVQRDTDRGDVIGGDPLIHDAAGLAIGASFRFDRRELLLEPGDDAVGEFAGALVFAAPLRLLQLDAPLVKYS